MKAGKSRMLLLAMAMGLAGCAFRYPPTPDADFEGITSEAARARIVRIFVIHGMGDHIPGYSDKLAGTLASRLGLTQQGAPELRLLRYPGPDVEAGTLRITRFSGNASGREQRIYELTWSPLTIPIKDRFLNYDRAPQYTFGRASINRTLKEGLIDRAFSDAILYVGAFGEAMRWAVKEAICHTLNDMHQGAGACDFTKADVAGLEADQLVLVSSSLGSRMLLDSIYELMGNGHTQDAVTQALGKTNLLYMMANQVSLLGLANVRVPLSGSEAVALGAGPSEPALRRFIDNWTLAREKRKQLMQIPRDAVQRPLRVVAFSDPNDLLSFRLTEHAKMGRRDVQFVNVTVSNVPEILGVLARPDRAHTGYGENPGVLDLVVCGSKDLTPACD